MAEYLDELFGGDDEGKRKKSKGERRGLKSSQRVPSCNNSMGNCFKQVRHQRIRGRIPKVKVKVPPPPQQSIMSHQVPRNLR